jgi:EAL domain-containing protein (putative c-di-GMP-specific phosphodiesterase class I)
LEIKAERLRTHEAPRVSPRIAVDSSANESVPEAKQNVVVQARRMATRPVSSESRSANSNGLRTLALDANHLSKSPSKTTARRPALALVVQRLVPLNEGVQPVRCEVLWALPRRSQPLGKREANARQIRMPSALERRALIEFCRWFRSQPVVWRDAMPIMWLKFSTRAMLDKRFIPFVERCLQAGPFPPDRLGFEIAAQDAAARADELANVAVSLKHRRSFLVLDNFTVQANHVDLLSLPAIRMVKLAPDIGTAMRSDPWLQKRVAAIAQTARALGIKLVVKRIQSQSEALWYRDYGIEFAQSQDLSPGEPIDGLANLIR